MTNGKYRLVILLAIVIIISGGVLKLSTPQIFKLVNGYPVVRGIVLSEQGEPVPGANIILESGYSDSPNGLEPQLTSTDQNGSFQIRARSDYFRLSIWKKGYALSGCNNQTCDSQEAKFTLRKIKEMKALPMFDQVFDLSQTRGFSFRSGHPVDPESPQCDLILDSKGRNDLVLGTPSNRGGITAIGSSLDLDDYWEAPMTFQSETELNKGDSNGFFLKTPNGLSVKFRIIPNWATTDVVKNRLDLSSVRFIWAIQTDGSRNLETISVQEVPEPFTGYIQ